jgi:putative transposase
MDRLLQPLFFYLAFATDRKLAKMVQFLKEENKILRDRLPESIRVTPQERQRLLKHGRDLGPALKDLITIVTPRTFARWLSGERTSKSSAEFAEPRQPGRPRTAEEIRELILRLARENAWGATRIRGELKKLAITIGRTTISEILVAHGFDSGPKRGEGHLVPK